MANPIPVFPEVGSIMVDPDFKSPCSSASLTMEKAMRSLMLPPGLFRSNFTHTFSAPGNNVFHDVVRFVLFCSFALLLFCS